MTLTIVTSNLIGAGAQFTFAANGDQLYVARGAVVASTTGPVFAGIDREALGLTIAGEVVSGNMQTFRIGADMTILSGGSFTSFQTAAVNAALFFSGSDASFTNFGSLNASMGIGVLARAPGIIVTNHGDISAASPVFVYDANASRVVNGGRIAASSANDASVNYRYNNGLVVDYSSFASVTNLATGVITATGETGAGVRFGAGTEGGVLMNSGLIESLQDFGVSLETAPESGAAIRVFNWGSISGGDGAFLGSANGDALMNRGLLRGRVDLGSGNDLFDNRNGRVDGDVMLGDGADTYNGMLNAVVNGTIYGGAGADSLFGGMNSDVIYGDDGNDRIVGFEGDDSLYGGLGDDVIAGREGQDLVDGGAGNDNISGGYGDDTVFGGAGADTIQGNEGNDRLVGGAGGDFLYGGAGQDVFVFNGVSDSPFAVVADRDRIMDFVSGEDMIELTQIDANTTLAGDQAFSFIGAAAFSSVAGQLRYDAATGLVSGDVNGDGVADLAFAIITRPAVLSAADFFL
ncbi:M10 family metallopeptidase C-terminal domain-containing protein [Pseudogemmobacter bohemicus]|uniref:M10 family metallopeptidase C-terminal domain-containing protein n=1 Tax=Pseudogemmobacter bohemicus TaxID=2250708 RepID=UPI0013002E6B|nr:M10 family metallopeptidase C-terminal domain-containing protein [Pseudogemmobacter bohemicus]